MQWDIPQRYLSRCTLGLCRSFFIVMKVFCGSIRYMVKPFKGPRRWRQRYMPLWKRGLLAKEGSYRDLRLDVMEKGDSTLLYAHLDMLVKEFFITGKGLAPLRGSPEGVYWRQGSRLPLSAALDTVTLR